MKPQASMRSAVRQARLNISHQLAALVKATDTVRADPTDGVGGASYAPYNGQLSGDNPTDAVGGWFMLSLQRPTSGDNPTDAVGGDFILHLQPPTFRR
ncbi:MAG TPA: hypothetical protein VN844_05920 [Pyrinomonadaceae bacterium]|nr:hypothetical protein [Pyrinomonadaceae bacterium]